MATIARSKWIAIALLFFFSFGIILSATPQAYAMDISIEIIKKGPMGLYSPVGEELLINKGDTAQLGLIYTKQSSVEISNEAVWQSQDENIVTVSNDGLITALAEGTAVIDAIWIAPDASMYSDQVRVIVSTAIPYSVDISPLDGKVSHYQILTMQFPVPVEITDPYKDEAKHSYSYYLYQDSDNTQVHVKCVPHSSVRHLFPTVDQLPWSTYSVLQNGAITAGRIDSHTFIDNIKPIDGVWDIRQATGVYRFATEADLPLELLGVYPEPGVSINTYHNGYVGDYRGGLLQPDSSLNIPLVFLFNQPVLAGDTSQFVISNISTTGNYSACINGYDYPVKPDLGNPYLFSGYMAIPANIYNFAALGYALTDTTTTAEIRPGAIKTHSGIFNTDTYSTTFQVNPSSANYILGSNKDNSLRVPDKAFPSGTITKQWQQDLYDTIPNAALLIDDMLIFGGKGNITSIDRVEGHTIWTYTSLQDDFRDDYLRPALGPDGAIYFIDYCRGGPNFNDYQPTLVSINQDGSLRWQRELPALNGWDDSLYITETGDIVIIYNMSNSLPLSQDTYHFLSRYSCDGDLLATAKIPQPAMVRVPQIIWADSTEVVWYNGGDFELIGGTIFPIGVFDDVVNTWSTPCPSLYNRCLLSTKIQDNSTLYILEGNYSQDNAKLVGTPPLIIELDLVDHTVIRHSPDLEVIPVNTPSRYNMYLLHYQDDKFYFNNGLMYDAKSMTTTLTQESWADDDTDYTIPKKVTLLTITNNDDEIWLYRVKSEYGVNYIIGGKDWNSDAFMWEYCPVIYQAWADGGLILDTYDGLIRLDTTQIVTPPTTPTEPTEPPPIKPPTGGGDPLKPDKPDSAEPDKPDPVESDKPDPADEPVNEPSETVQPVIPVATPKPTPKLTPEPKEPRIIEVVEPEPVIRGTVRGTVILSDGRPLSNTRLELHSSKLLITTTNSNGDYIFTNVPLGSYELYIADIKVSNEEGILLANITVKTEGETHFISKVDYNKITQTADVTLTKDNPDQIVIVIVDYTVIDSPAKIRWYWFLPLLLLPIIFRRRREQ